MIEYLNQLDSTVFLFFNGMHAPFFDKFMMLCTGRFIWIPMYATILFILFKTFKPKMVLVYVAAIVLAITLTDQTCATVIRPIVERLRPSNPDNPLSAYAHLVNGYRGGAYGFPSCHSANSFALAVFMGCLIGRRRFSMFIFGWAILNSYSRLYLGVHYPGDLLVGAVIGSAYGYGCYMFTKLFNSERTNAVLPRFHTPIFTLNLKSPIIPLQQTVGITVGDVMIFTGAVTLFIISATSLISLG